jgi:hypothetical protein
MSLRTTQTESVMMTSGKRSNEDSLDQEARNRLVGILDYIDDKFGETARDHFKIKTKEFTIASQRISRNRNFGNPRQEFKRVSTNQTDQSVLQKYRRTR